MAKKQESKWNIEDLTDAEICAAIRYLEPDSESANEQNEQDDSTVFVICASLMILLIGCLGFVWLYR